MAYAVLENRTMDKLALVANPFALMMHPDAVVQAMERSDRLGHLQRRICKPLDKTVIPHTPEDDDAAAYDEPVDDSDDSQE
jgi:hypothetical protein